MDSLRGKEPATIGVTSVPSVELTLIKYTVPVLSVFAAA